MRHQPRPTLTLTLQAKTLDTMPVEVELESLDGNVRRTVSAFTTEKVTGKLRGNRPEKVSQQVATPDRHPVSEDWTTTFSGCFDRNCSRRSALFTQRHQRKTRQGGGQINPFRLDIRGTY